MSYVPSRAPLRAPSIMSTAPDPPTASPSPTSGLTHLPGLDGLRALAVVLVLLFHNGFTWMSGGFLGVSVFFTLSGYLITSLLLGEHASTGGISLRSFWSRRFRRLLPASLLAIALAIAFSLVAADPTQRAEVGGDVVASLAYVANWWFLASEQTYAALFSAPSPLLHFWSLAIEEQFYLLLPLAAVATVGRRHLFTVGVVVVLAATVAIPFVTGASDDWLYYATPARLPELLTGVLLALALARGDLRRRLTTSTAVALPTIVGLGALGATVWLAATSSIASSWLYRGGFAAFSLVSVALIVATHSPRSLATRALSLPPLQHLGRISYGVYLYHWPIFLWLDPARTGLDGWPLFIMRMAVTLTLAELSYRYVEMPIRRTGHLGLPLPSLTRLSLTRLAPIAIAVLAVGAVLTSITAPPKAIDFDLASKSLASLGGGDGAAPPTTVPVADTSSVDAVLASLPAEPPTPRVAVFGDSTALMTGFGLGAAIVGRPGEVDYAEGVALLGCGVNPGDRRLLRTDDVDTVPRRCRPWTDYWSERVRANAPNVAFVQVGPWDVMARQVTPDGPFFRPGDPEWDRAVLADLLAAVDTLSAAGAYTLWATAPLPNANLDAATHFAGPESVDPARFAQLNTLIAQLPELRPGKVGVIDLAGWHAARSDDTTLRPDGVHLSGEGGALVGREFLMDEISRQFDLAWRSGAVPRLVAEHLVANERRPEPPALPPEGTLRVAVWGDDLVTAVAEQVRAGATAAGIPVEIQIVGDPACGLSRGVERRRGDDVLPAAATCGDRSEVARDLATFDPHLVVVAPGAHDAAEHRPWPDWDQWKIPGDPFIDIWLLRDYAAAVDLAGRTGALVTLTALNPGEGEPYTTAINDVVLEVSMAPDRASWLANIPAADAASWAVGRLRQPTP